MTERVFNFAAGPAVLPLPVLEEAQRDLLALPGIGISILESSHRSRWFTDIIEEAEENLRRLLAVPDGYQVLFLQGGAQLQFSMVPMSFLGGTDRVASYLVTGSWGKKALAEARREGETQVAWSGEEEGFKRVPGASEVEIAPDAAYLHLTSNETIQGVQFAALPEVGDVPVVCDASSDFLSRPIPMADYALLYACAQKNAGPAGLTIVLIRDDFLARRRQGLHSMLDYGKHAEAGSRLNTPSVFGVYVFLLVTRWIEKEMGGLESLARHNEKKAALLYNVLDDDGGDFFVPHAEADSRSQMNVTFRLRNEELEPVFLEEAKSEALWELKGHRSVGGFRASIYNAMPEEGVAKLRDFMLAFKARHS